MNVTSLRGPAVTTFVALLLAAASSAQAAAPGAGPAWSGPARAAQSAPALASASSTATRGQARRLRIRSPRSLTAGDVMVAALTVRSGRSVRLRAPAGWRRLRRDRSGRRNGLAQVLYFKRVGASEPASYRWSFSRRSTASGGILSYRGVDVADPVDAHRGRAVSVRTRSRASRRRTSRRRIVAPSLRTSGGGAVVVGFFGSAGRMRTAPPAGTVERYDRASRGRPGRAVTSAAVDFAMAAPGATGAKVATARCARLRRARRCRPASRLIGQLVALRPAGSPDTGGPGASPPPTPPAWGPGGGQSSPLPESTGPVFYVSPSGSDAGPGSLAAPWRTIQKALSTLRPGERARVRAGTYVEDLEMRRAGTATAPITVEASPGERPVLRSTGGHPLEVGSSGAYFRFRAFVIEGHPGTSGGNVDIYGHHVEISANEIRDGRDQGIYTSDDESHHAFILGNRIHDNGEGVMHQSHGIYLQGEDHLVANNVIHDQPEGFGIQVYDRNSRSTIVNNTIVRSGHAGIVVGGDGGVDNIHIHNNILAFNAHGGLETDSTCPDGPVWVDHNVIFGNDFPIETGCSQLDTSGGNRTTDPLFADHQGSNLHLRLGSPAIGYALGGLAPPTDHDGASRPQGGAPDAGAYEDG